MRYFLLDQQVPFLKGQAFSDMFYNGDVVKTIFEEARNKGTTIVVTRHLSQEEKNRISAGMVFIYDVKEIERWTDSRIWNKAYSTKAGWLIYKERESESASSPSKLRVRRLSSGNNIRLCKRIISDPDSSSSLRLVCYTECSDEGLFIAPETRSVKLPLNGNGRESSDEEDEGTDGSTRSGLRRVSRSSSSGNGSNSTSPTSSSPNSSTSSSSFTSSFPRSSATNINPKDTAAALRHSTSSTNTSDTAFTAKRIKTETPDELTTIASVDSLIYESYNRATDPISWDPCFANFLSDRSSANLGLVSIEQTNFGGTFLKREDSQSSFSDTDYSEASLGSPSHNSLSDLSSAANLEFYFESNEDSIQDLLTSVHRSDSLLPSKPDTVFMEQDFLSNTTTTTTTTTTQFPFVSSIFSNALSIVNEQADLGAILLESERLL